MILKKYIYVFPLILSVFIQGCGTVKNASDSATLKVPSSFGEVKDSSSTKSLGNLNISTLFPDTQLVSLIKLGLQNNQDVLIASERIEVSRANYRISKGALLPTLFLEPSAGVRRYADYTIDGVGNFDTNLSDHLPEDKRIPGPTPDYFIGFRSSWEIDLWGKLRKQKKASFARFLATEKGRHLIITNLIADIASAYYTLLALDSELETIQKNIKLQQTALETTKLLKEGGMTNELAVNQFSAQLLNTQALEVRTRQDIIATENRLNVLLGRFPEPISRGLSIQKQSLPEEVHVGIPSEMLLNRPDIQKAEFELMASKADVMAARRAFLPSLEITANTGLHAFKSSVLFSHPGSLAWGILGGLSAPIFNRNIIKSNYRSALASNKESYYEYQKSVITGYTEVVTSLKNMENLEAIAAMKEQEVSVLEQGVATSNDLFLAGYASYLEVINAQRNVLAAQLEFTNNKKEQFLALVNLYRSLGGGWR